MKYGALNAMDEEYARRCCGDILEVLKKLERCQPGSGLPAGGGDLLCKIKALELCVHAMSEFMAEEHFTVTVQLHDKVELTGRTWLPE